MSTAIGGGGAAISTGLALWHLRALNLATDFAASHRSLMKLTGLSEKRVRSGLRVLTSLGLIEVLPQIGRNSIYRLIS